MTAPDRVTQFEADIAASPDALARLLDRWSPVDLDHRSRFMFCGLGSSRYAALIVAAALRARGTAAWAEYASSATPAAPSADLVAVAISASGRTREVIDAAERHRGTSLVVAVTNDPGSRLASVADVVVPLEAGEETGGIACRTFRATIAALALLSGVAVPGALRPTIDDLGARFATADAWRAPLADALDGAPSIDVLADASLLGLAEQAALMLREAPRLPARGYDTGDWLHTGVYLALPGHRALLFAGSTSDAEAVATIERRGGRVVQAAPTAGNPVVRAIAESIVAELVAAELWRRTDAEVKVT